MNRLLRIAKRIYYEKKIDASKSNAKASWRVLNEIIKTKKKAFKINSIFKVDNQEITDPVDIAAGLAQSVERLTAEREVAGSIPGAGPILRVLK